MRMFFWIVHVLTVATLVTIVKNQLFVQNQVVRYSCIDLPLKENLTLSMIGGDWFEIARTPNPWENGSCTQLRQIPVRNGEALEMIWEEIFTINSQKSIRRYKHAFSIGTPSQGNQTARLNIRFYIPDQNYLVPFHVIDTDYDNYMVTYSCIQLPDFYNITFYSEYIWIWSRNRDSRIKYKIWNKLMNMGIYVQWLRIVDQSNCVVQYSQLNRYN